MSGIAHGVVALVLDPQLFRIPGLAMNLMGVGHGHDGVTLGMDDQDVADGGQTGADVEMPASRKGRFQDRIQLGADLACSQSLAGDGGCIGDQTGHGMGGSMGQYHRAAETAAEKTQKRTAFPMTAKGGNGTCQIFAAHVQGIAPGKVTRAVAATAEIESQIADATMTTGSGQGDLFGRTAIGQQAVAADHHRGWCAVRQMKGAHQLVCTGIEGEVLLHGRWHPVPYRLK